MDGSEIAVVTTTEILADYNASSILAGDAKWVRYSDYKKVQEERDELRKLLSQSVDTMRELMDIN